MDQIKELAAVKIELGHDEQSYASSQQEVRIAILTSCGLIIRTLLASGSV